MSVQLYDEAFKNKLLKWTKDTDVTIFDPNETRQMIEVMADKNNDSPIVTELLLNYYGRLILPCSCNPFYSNCHIFASWKKESKY